MDPRRFERVSEIEWRLPPQGAMRVPAVLYASEPLVRDMDDKVLEQMSAVAVLPGIVRASYAMPDAHWGYGFPIGGVGFDISCGVRMLHTGLRREQLEAEKRPLADALFRAVPAGVGSTGALHLGSQEMEAMLAEGARWAVSRGHGEPSDLERIEERGTMAGARPECVSEQARKRQQDQVGTLGSGNHYLEVQRVAEIHDEEIARVFGLALDAVVVSIHCGSRGLGHQIGTDYLRRMTLEAPRHGLKVPDRELACAPLRSVAGEEYLGAMRAAMNCAMANRQVLTAIVRRVFAQVLPAARLPLLYDVSHNTCKEETHLVDGARRRLFVHRKGATRAFGPGHPEVPDVYRKHGQPVIIGGSMGTSSFVLAGTAEGAERSFGSACHGAGRSMSRNEATRRYDGRTVVDELAARGILIRSPSLRGVAEEAPLAYKDSAAVVEAAERAGLARRVARVEPMVCVKG